MDTLRHLRLAGLLGLLCTTAMAQSSGSIVIEGARVFLLNPESGSVSIIDANTDRVVSEGYAGADPRSVALSIDGNALYVTDQQSASLVVMDPVKLRRREIVRVDAEPYGVVVDSDGLVYVSSSAASVIDVVKIRSVDESIDIPIPRKQAAAPRSAVIDRIPVAAKPKGLAISSDGTRLYATHFLTGDVSVIDLAQRRVVQVISTGSDSNMAQKIAIHPQNGRAYLPHIRSNVTNPFLLFDTTIFPTMSVIDLKQNQHSARERIDLSLGIQSVNLPVDVAFSPNGARLYEVNLGSEDVGVVDIATQQRIALIDVGNAPRSIAVTPDGSKAYVVNSLSDDVSVLDLLSLKEIRRIPIRPSALSPEIRRGKVMFFSSRSSELSRDRWMSCASCHFEGETDGRTWQFTSGPRNTTSMRGLADTLPLHWSADRDEVQDFEFTIRTLQAGSGLIKNGEPKTELGPSNAKLSADLDALAAFVMSMNHKSNPFAARDVDRGRAIFNRADVGCSNCHRAPLYTDSTLHNVGTGDDAAERMGPAFDTPSLRGIWDTAPYLHDGSAATLRDVVITRNPQDRHGRTAHLTAAEIEDLVMFLSSL